jgi:hypothetical protein
MLMNEWLDEYRRWIGQVEPDPSDVNPEPQDPEDPGEPEEEKSEKTNHGELAYLLVTLSSS